MEMLRIFEVKSDSFNGGGICAQEKYLRERLEQLNPEDEPTIRRNVDSCLPNDTTEHPGRLEASNIFVLLLILLLLLLLLLLYTSVQS